MKKPQKPRIKIRDWHAVNAHFRKAGSMKDQKKAENKRECRKPVRPE